MSSNSGVRLSLRADEVAPDIWQRECLICGKDTVYDTRDGGHADESCEHFIGIDDQLPTLTFRFERRH